MDRTLAFFNAFFEGKYYLTIFEGIVNTLTLTAVATTIGLLIGLIVAIIQVIEKPKHNGISLIIVNALKFIAKIYVDIIRGTPAVVQISFLWMVVLGPLQIPRVLVGGIAFGINSGAYMSEIIRGGILSIDKGQMEAGRSLGLTYIQTMREIIDRKSVV